MSHGAGRSRRFCSVVCSGSGGFVCAFADRFVVARGTRQANQLALRSTLGDPDRSIVASPQPKTKAITASLIQLDREVTWNQAMPSEHQIIDVTCGVCYAISHITEAALSRSRSA